MKILIATNNLHKIEEIKKILSDDNLNILTPNMLNLPKEDIEESSATYHGNAGIKAKYFYHKSGIASLADDSGIEVEALNGAPAVHTARYAGINATDKMNRNKLIEELKHSLNRNAQFVCVLCYYDGVNEHFFEGICKGKIAYSEYGETGFGYDPIFIPDGYNITFSQMDDNTKNRLSHRYKALLKFKEFLNKL